jgi:hypothetical protein
MAMLLSLMHRLDSREDWQGKLCDTHPSDLRFETKGSAHPKDEGCKAAGLADSLGTLERPLERVDPRESGRNVRICPKTIALGQYGLGRTPNGLSLPKSTYNPQKGVQ